MSHDLRNSYIFLCGRCSRAVAKELQTVWHTVNAMVYELCLASSTQPIPGLGLTLVKVDIDRGNVYFLLRESELK